MNNIYRMIAILGIFSVTLFGSVACGEGGDSGDDGNLPKMGALSEAPLLEPGEKTRRIDDFKILGPGGQIFYSSSFEEPWVLEEWAFVNWSITSEGLQNQTASERTVPLSVTIQDEMGVILQRDRFVECSPTPHAHEVEFTTPGNFSINLEMDQDFASVAIDIVRDKASPPSSHGCILTFQCQVTGPSERVRNQKKAGKKRLKHEWIKINSDCPNNAWDRNGAPIEKLDNKNGKLIEIWLVNDIYKITLTKKKAETKADVHEVSSNGWAWVLHPFWADSRITSSGSAYHSQNWVHDKKLCNRKGRVKIHCETNVNGYVNLLKGQAAGSAVGYTQFWWENKKDQNGNGLEGRCAAELKLHASTTTEALVQLGFEWGGIKFSLTPLLSRGYGKISDSQSNWADPNFESENVTFGSRTRGHTETYAYQSFWDLFGAECKTFLKGSVRAEVSLFCTGAVENYNTYGTKPSYGNEHLTPQKPNQYAPTNGNSSTEKMSKLITYDSTKGSYSQVQGEVLYPHEGINKLSTVLDRFGKGEDRFALVSPETKLKAWHDGFDSHADAFEAVGNGDDKVTLDEIKDLCVQLKIWKFLAKTILKRFDLNKNGSVSLSEFEKVMSDG